LCQLAAVLVCTAAGCAAPGLHEAEATRRVEAAFSSTVPALFPDQDIAWAHSIGCAVLVDRQLLLVTPHEVHAEQGVVYVNAGENFYRKVAGAAGNSVSGGWILLELDRPVPGFEEMQRVAMDFSSELAPGQRVYVVSWIPDDPWAARPSFEKAIDAERVLALADPPRERPEFREFTLVSNRLHRARGTSGSGVYELRGQTLVLVGILTACVPESNYCRLVWRPRDLSLPPQRDEAP
jgi:hypothetical protein